MVWSSNVRGSEINSSDNRMMVSDLRMGGSEDQADSAGRDELPVFPSGRKNGMCWGEAPYHCYHSGGRWLLAG